MSLRGSAYDHFENRLEPAWSRNKIFQFHPGAEVRYCGLRLVLADETNAVEPYPRPPELTEERIEALNRLGQRVANGEFISHHRHRMVAGLVILWGPEQLEDYIDEARHGGYVR